MEKYTIEYLRDLIENQIEENLHLEYKSSGALAKQNDKTSEISKDVSAMANSDGGILIYGIKEDENNRHLPKEIQHVNRKDFSKEWLAQIIHEKIQPRIDGVQIFPIALSNESVVYVVEIPKSSTAHQAADKKYYKRSDSISAAMYDYEIRDILNRAKNPKIKLEFKYIHDNHRLIVTAYNCGAVYANYLNVNLRLPRKIAVNQHSYQSVGDDKVEIFASNAVRDMVDQFAAVARYYPPRYEPILPQTRFRLVEIALHGRPFSPENILEWDIFCDNTNPASGSIRLADLINS
jgi:Putative DNA-binding domain